MGNVSLKVLEFFCSKKGENPVLRLIDRFSLTGIFQMLEKLWKGLFFASSNKIKIILQRADATFPS